ncbi:MAG: ATP-binding protein [Kofleriaceae bacterium]
MTSEIAGIEDAVGACRADSQHPLREQHLARMLRLSAVELDLMWTAVAATSDPTLSPDIRDLCGGEGRHGISQALYAVLAGLDASSARALALTLTPLHPLLRYGLLELRGDGLGVAQPLAATPRTASYLAGLDRIDEQVLRLGGELTVVREPLLTDAQLEVIRGVSQAITADVPMLIVIEGQSQVGKRTAAALAALAGGRRVLQLDASRVRSTAELESGFHALRRECLLAGALPLVSHVDELFPAGGDTGAARGLFRLLDETPIPVLLTSSTIGLEIACEREIVRMTLPSSDATARKAIWSRAVTDVGGDPAELDLDLLATRYALGAGSIQRAASVARLLTRERIDTQHLVGGVRQGIVDRLGDLAQRVEVKQSWDDLVLSADTVDQISALVARVRHGQLVYDDWGFGAKFPRGLGTAALFSGAPGTGKTMVAGLIARELDLELYQVDLSKVVSKWVGETEKQLAKIFDAAEAGHALLLFDEADSLFAKRTEVKSAIDRYANLEVNYLLQRIESFGGISILTTNLDTSIDPALRRRLAAHIVFYPPEADERAVLWQQMIPKDAPVSTEVDFVHLAETFPDMTGANIRNAVVSAGFLAASESAPRISRAHLERAGRGEYRAMGRVIR